MAGAIEGAIGTVEGQWEAFVGANRGESDDIAIGADAGRHALAEFQKNAGSILVGISDLERLVDLQVACVRKSA
jgi:hypothetical protein